MIFRAKTSVVSTTMRSDARGPRWKAAGGAEVGNGGGCREAEGRPNGMQCAPGWRRASLLAARSRTDAQCARLARCCPRRVPRPTTGPQGPGGSWDGTSTGRHRPSPGIMQQAGYREICPANLCGKSGISVNTAAIAPLGAACYPCRHRTASIRRFRRFPLASSQ